MKKRNLILLTMLLGLAFSSSRSPASGNDLSGIDQQVSRADELIAQKRFGEAETVLQAALVDVRQKVGSFHPATAGINRRLAAFLIDRNRLAEAERCLQRALVITAGYTPAAALDGEFRGTTVFTNNALQNPDSLPGSFELADVLEGYASLFSKQSRFNDAERLLKTASRIYDDGAGSRAAVGYVLRGDSHESQLRTILLLADIQSKQSRVVEAEQTFQKALALTKSRKGNASPDVAYVLRTFADFYRSQGRTSDAESLEAEATSILR